MSPRWRVPTEQLHIQANTIIIFACQRRRTFGFEKHLEVRLPFHVHSECHAGDLQIIDEDLDDKN